MTKYIITTESGSDLPEELIEQFNVYIVPMHLTLGDQTYLDGEVSVSDIFAYYDETGNLPKTSGSTPQDNETVFRQVFADHPDATIIHIAYSAATTVSYNSARLAAEEFEAGRIYFIDSKHLSFSLTTLIRAAHQFISTKPDASAEDVLTYISELSERTKFHFLPHTLTYLKAGGRVSSTSVFAAKLLRIYPAIHMEDGLLVAGRKYRGSFKQAVKKLIYNFLDSFDIESGTLIVGGSNGFSDANKAYVYDLLGDYGIKDVLWMETGSVISSHGGPGGFGITGIEKT